MFGFFENTLKSVTEYFGSFFSEGGDIDGVNIPKLRIKKNDETHSSASDDCDSNLGANALQQVTQESTSPEVNKNSPIAIYKTRTPLSEDQIHAITNMNTILEYSDFFKEYEKLDNYLKNIPEFEKIAKWFQPKPLSSKTKNTIISKSPNGVMRGNELNTNFFFMDKTSTSSNQVKAVGGKHYNFFISDDVNTVISGSGLANTYILGNGKDTLIIGTEKENYTENDRRLDIISGFEPNIDKICMKHGILKDLHMKKLYCNSTITTYMKQCAQHFITQQRENFEKFLNNFQDYHSEDKKNVMTVYKDDRSTIVFAGLEKDDIIGYYQKLSMELVIENFRTSSSYDDIKSANITIESSDALLATIPLISKENFEDQHQVFYNTVDLLGYSKVHNFGYDCESIQ